MTDTPSSDPFAIRTVTKQCVECARTFQVETCAFLQPRFCSECGDRQAKQRDAEERARAARERELRWREICPSEMRLDSEGGQTSLERIKRDQAAALSEALRWTYGRRGLLICGPTGAGKTRIAWRVIRREFDAGRSITAVKGHRLAMDAQLSSVRGFHDEWFGRLVAAPLLFVDDFNKGRLTDLVEAALFGLVDERCEAGLPIVLTTNAPPSALAESMSSDRGEPFLRRLRQYCATVVVPPLE